MFVGSIPFTRSTSLSPFTLLVRADRDRVGCPFDQNDSSSPIPIHELPARDMKAGPLGVES